MSSRRVVAAVVFLLAFGIFVSTAERSIDWYDSSRYGLAASTLGVPLTPGSLILTLLGWAALHLPFPHGQSLALVGAFGGAVTVLLMFLVGSELLKISGLGASTSSLTAVGAGALATGFCAAIWEYSVQFTPYILTTVVTGTLLWSAMRWWGSADAPHAERWLFLMALLIGVDFSVHRTNALLLPSLMTWILFRRPNVLRSLRTWLGGLLALGVGLSVHLLLMPMAARNPALNTGDPSNWRAFIEYVTMSRGCPTCLQILPRNGPFWSVQVRDFFQAFGHNFFSVDGRMGILGILPGLIGCFGAWSLWKQNRRLGVAVLAMLLLHACVTIVYFNIPADFFRTLYRHYLPIFVLFGVLVCYGMTALSTRLKSFAAGQWRWQTIAAALLVLVVPSVEFGGNYATHDASRRFFAEDFAKNMLVGVPQGAILITQGDNDSFPLWYMQEVEGLRKDVTVVCLVTATDSASVLQMVRRDPTFPLRPGDSRAIITALNQDAPIPVKLPEGPPMLVDPRLTRNGSEVDMREAVLLVMLARNSWKRPIAIANTFGENDHRWLRGHLRNEGFISLIVPEADPVMDVKRTHLTLMDPARYRGYNDGSIVLDDTSRMMGLIYYRGFATLARAQAISDSAACLRTAATADEILPIARLNTELPRLERLDSICEGVTRKH